MKNGKPTTLKEMRSMGGRKRAEVLSKTRMSEIARLGGLARAKKAIAVPATT